MSQVIYADVLVVINFYVTYFLLCATALLCRSRINRMRFLLSSFFGGAYSLTVLLGDCGAFLSALMKLTALIVPVIIAFKFRSLKEYLRINLSFILCNFLFAGLMVALWYFVCPSGMYYNGTVLYFNIDILDLVIFTVICYAFIRLFELFFRTRAPINTVFDCKVILNEKSVTLRAFLDTGNNLCDPFSSKPIIIADKTVFASFFESEAFCENKIRYVLCSTVSGKALLPSFAPDYVRIRSADRDFETDEVMIALTEEKLLSGEYDAILPMGLLYNKPYRKDERESEENSFVLEKVEIADKRKAVSVGGFLRQRSGKSSCTADQGKGK